MWTARVPHGHRPGLARQQRGVGEDLTRSADQARLLATQAPPLLLAVAEILGDNRRIEICWRRRRAGWQDVVDRLVAAIGNANMQFAARVAFPHIATAGSRRPDAGQIDRAMADIVIGVAAEVFRRELPVAGHQPFLDTTEHLGLALASVPAAELQVEIAR